MTAMLSTLPRLLVLVVAVFLAGCAGVPRPGIVGAEGRVVAPDLAFTMRDGTMLPARAWLPPSAAPPSAVILALHGFNDSRDAWETSGPALAAAGLAIYAPDQRGFGETAARGHWAGWRVMAGDVVDMAAALRRRHPGVPLYLMGESMGGALLMCLAGGADPPPVDGYVLIAPAVWGRAEMTIAMTGGLWAAATVAPGWLLTGRELPIKMVASDNRAALVRLSRDPLTIRETRVDTLRGLVDLMDAAQAAAPHVRGAVLMLDGGRDEIVPPGATAITWRALPRTVRRALYPDGYHLLLRDKDRAAPIGDIIAWIGNHQEWLPSGADTAAASWWAGQGWEGSVPDWLPSVVDGWAG